MLYAKEYAYTKKIVPFRTQPGQSINTLAITTLLQPISPALCCQLTVSHDQCTQRLILMDRLKYLVLEGAFTSLVLILPVIDFDWENTKTY